MNYFSENFDPSLQKYLHDISQYPLISRQREIELAALIKKGDKTAYTELVRANLRLVVKIAREFANIGLPLLDLISEGNIGLMKAAKRFDPGKGAKMSTYGAWWIQQSIKRALANQSKTIRLPMHLVDKLAKIRRVGDGLAEALGREATHEEIAEEVGMLPSKVARLKMSAVPPTSLDGTLGDDGTTELSEIVSDTMAFNPFKQLNEKDMRGELSELLGQLDQREQAVLNSRFGLDGSEPSTLEEAGRTIGVTRERIRQIQNRALLKMRLAFHSGDEMSCCARRLALTRIFHTGGEEETAVKLDRKKRVRLAIAL